MSKRAFTLAEVLITLTIIGIVAAIVVPSLVSEINDKAWSSKRAALYARLSNAISGLERMGGYGKYEEKTNNDGSKTATDTASETLVLNVLSKVYKMKSICGPDSFAKCGPKYQFTNAANTLMSFPANINTFVGKTNIGNIATRPTSFETFNGELIVVYYNPNCRYTRSDATQILMGDALCINMIYDLNGPKSPNQVGKDVGFISAFAGLGISPEIVMPIPIQSYKFTGTTDANYEGAIENCQTLDENYMLPSLWEMASVMVNRSLINPELVTGWDGWWYKTSTPYSVGSGGSAWVMEGKSIKPAAKNSNGKFYCTQKQ